MAAIKKMKISPGIFWVEIKEANLYLLCGCPADCIKHLKKRGLIELTEKDGVQFETGPNAILLSDLKIQKNQFTNLSEFPVLQMLYLQGMYLPNHPNNTGKKPVLIGSEEQVNAQMEYIYRGNYGLTSVEEIMSAGISKKEADIMMAIKLKFAFGKINLPNALIDERILENKPIEIFNHVKIARLDNNVFEICYNNEKVQVNLNLHDDETYEAPYQLGFHHISKEDFAVIHSGEGDGWDINRPCMASILIYKGKIYLLDAGPNVMASLNYLGISVEEIEGIFHTHGHDDHFAGLVSLVRTSKKLKYYSSPLIRIAVSKKFGALLGIEESEFTNLFDCIDIPLNKYTIVDGLEVMPVYSPHPVETNIFFFRVKHINDYKTYAHLGDITAFEILKRFNEQGVIPDDYLETIKKNYLTPVDLKKIDVGGGLIHGDAQDFKDDKSTKLIFAHLNKPLSLQQRHIGSTAAFGMMDILIPAQEDYLINFALEYLKNYYPDAQQKDLEHFLNNEIANYNAGTVIIKKGAECNYVYLIVTGNVESLNELGQQTLSAGALIIPEENETKSLCTYWAGSNTNILTIPIGQYMEFIKKNESNNMAPINIF